MKVVIKRHMQAFCLLEREIILVHNLDADPDAGAGVAAEPPCVDVSTKIREISNNKEVIVYYREISLTALNLVSTLCSMLAASAARKVSRAPAPEPAVVLEKVPSEVS